VRALTSGNALWKMYTTYERRNVRVCKTLSRTNDSD